MGFFVKFATHNAIKYRMRIDTNFIESNFEIFNRDYFEGKLPKPKFAVGRARMVLGSLNYKRRCTLLGSKIYDYTIRLSVYYDLDERKYLNTLLHEMIHYYISYNKIKDTSAHGKVFRTIMKDLNRKYGWEMSVSTKLQTLNAEVKRAPVERLVLAAVSENDDYYLSVINPRYAHYVDKIFRNAPNIRSHGWFIGKDEYFNSFRQVRSPRARKVSRKMYEEKIRVLTPFKLI